jgi:4-amino-4-deoxy-L-arabinose transferase-like glycosyltransferase
LLYWLDAASFSVLGVSVWAARLVPALHAGLMLAVLYAAATRITTAPVARRAALMLGTSLAFLLGGQYVNHDMLVATWMGVAIWLFAFSLMHGEVPHAGLSRLGFLACALGILSKGLIGLLLPGLVLVVWVLWTRQLRKVWRMPWASGTLLLAVVAVPWFVLAQREHPGLMDYMFGLHQFGRFTSSNFNNGRPWWFYLLAMLLMMFPWSLTALTLGLSTLRARLQRLSGKAPPSERTEGRGLASPIAAPWLALCWIWLLAILVFFSIPHSKLVGYILPVMPPLALLAALGWQLLLRRSAHEGRWLAGMLALTLTVAVAVEVTATRFTQRTGAQAVASTLACLAHPGDTVMAAGKYPYDVPFLAQTTRPVVMFEDWTLAARLGQDNWRKELLDAAAFDPARAAALMPDIAALPAASQVPGRWLVAPTDWAADPEHQALLQGWKPVVEPHPAPSGSEEGGWLLWRSAPESPESAQHPGLPGCQRRSAKP